MGLLDQFLNQGGSGGSGLGAIAQLIASNPQILQAAVSLLNPNDRSVGGNGGLPGLVEAFQGQGLGDVIGSWVGGGPNQAVSGGQVADALGPATLEEFATKAGIGSGEAGNVLASVLPALVNHVTPQGRVPDTPGLEAALGGLLGGLMR